MEPKLGDTILDNDPRCAHYADGQGRHGVIRAFTTNRKSMLVKWNTGRRTWCKVSRITGGNGGYTLIQTSGV